MPRGKRRVFSSTFKADVIRDLLSAKRSQAELCRQHQLSPSLLTLWKDSALERLPLLFHEQEQRDPEQARIAEEAGRLAIELTARVLDQMSASPAVHIARAEGLVGQAAADKQVILLTDVPAGYLPILLFLIIALGLSTGFGVLPMIVARVTGAHRPDPAKLREYECGFTAVEGRQAEIGPELRRLVEGARRRLDRHERRAELVRHGGRLDVEINDAHVECAHEIGDLRCGLIVIPVPRRRRVRVAVIFARDGNRRRRRRVRDQQRVRQQQREREHGE